MWTLTGVASARGKGESRETISGHNRPNSIDATFQNSNWQPNKMRKPVEKKDLISVFGWTTENEPSDPAYWVTFMLATVSLKLLMILL